MLAHAGNPCRTEIPCQRTAFYPMSMSDEETRRAATSPDQLQQMFDRANDRRTEDECYAGQVDDAELDGLK